MWLVEATVCLLAAPWVQLSVSAGTGWPHSALRHHWLTPISCHFRDCKALLVTSLTHVSGAITSVQTFTFDILWPYLLNSYIICHLTLVMKLHYLTLHKNWNATLTSWSIDIFGTVYSSGHHRRSHWAVANTALFRATCTPKPVLFRATRTTETKTI